MTSVYMALGILHDKGQTHSMMLLHPLLPTSFPTFSFFLFLYLSASDSKPAESFLRQFPQGSGGDINKIFMNFWKLGNVRKQSLAEAVSVASLTCLTVSCLSLDCKCPSKVHVIKAWSLVGSIGKWGTFSEKSWACWDPTLKDIPGLQ